MRVLYAAVWPCVAFGGVDGGDGNRYRLVPAVLHCFTGTRGTSAVSSEPSLDYRLDYRPLFQQRRRVGPEKVSNFLRNLARPPRLERGTLCLEGLVGTQNGP